MDKKILIVPAVNSERTAREKPTDLSAAGVHVAF